MKILAISGGMPNGNNDSMAKEALMGAKEQGAEIEFIHLLDLEMKVCTGCNACTSGLLVGNAGTCPVKDDVAWLDDKILDADGVIFVMPIFESGAPSAFKVLQDRIFGPSHSAGLVSASKAISDRTGTLGPDVRKLKRKACGFIALGGSEWTNRIASEFFTASQTMLWNLIDIKVFQWSTLAIIDDSIVAQCHELGAQVARAAGDIMNAKYLGEPGICPNCHNRNFYIHTDGTAECEACSLIGNLVVEDGRVVGFTFDEAEMVGAHSELTGRIKHRNDLSDNRAKLMESKKSAEYKVRVQRYKDFIQPTRPMKN